MTHGETICKNCKYFKLIYKADDDGYGRCRRYPRTLVDQGWEYPMVNINDWCGEHKECPGVQKC